MLKYGPMCMWDVSQVQIFSYACSFLHETENVPFHSDLYWDTSAATHMERMFINNIEFRGDLSTWDVRQVRDMDRMFLNTRIEDSGIGSWDVRSLETARNMFTNARFLSRALDLSRWNMRHCKDLTQMFAGSSIEDSGIGKWTLHPDATTFLILQGASSFTGDLSGSGLQRHTRSAAAPATVQAPRFGAVDAPHDEFF